MIAILAACSSCSEPKGSVRPADTSLVAIDGLLWTQPDSAFAQLQGFAENHEVDSLDPFNRHYFHLLLSELLYKNDYAQTNRDELLLAVDYYDSLVAEGGSHADAALLFLDARAHYIDGVGYYEMDSVIPACEHYLKALEVMEEHFDEKELVGKKAQFMALAFTHLTALFSDQYLHEQALYYGNQALHYYDRYDAEPWHVSWMLEETGVYHDILEKWDSAAYYYHEAEKLMSDTNTLIYRDIETHLAHLSYEMGGSPTVAIERLSELLSRSVTAKEYYARCLVIGEILFQEQQYDSAQFYLDKVYLETESTKAKSQAAEWLAIIREHKGLDPGEYAAYLVPLANQEPNQSETKSLLAEQFGTHLRNTHEISHQRRIKRQMKTSLVIAGALVSLLLIYFIAFYVNKRKRKHLESDIIEERFAHQAKQKALGAKLVKRNEALRLVVDENKKLHALLEALRRQKTRGCYDEFMNEPICQSIVGRLKDQPVKRVAKNRDYPELKLTDSELSQLAAVVANHFEGFGELLTALYPKITRNEINQCHLCLLNLPDAQIAALLHNDYSTVKRRSNKLRKVFSTKKTPQMFLMEKVC